MLDPAIGDIELARRQIESAALAGDEQQRLRERALAFCRDQPESLHRSCSPGHLTGSGVVVDRSRDRTLLIHHNKLDRWLQPGGHADGDGNLAAVAWREATEETGLRDLALVTPAIDLDIHVIPARPGEPEHLHVDLRFVLLAGAGQIPSPNGETRGARWLSSDDPAVTASAELHRAVVRAVEVARSFPQAGVTGR
jgi:8-oxo-dGTP pyrophosphatase MutT (NUDIX family)